MVYCKICHKSKPDDHFLDFPEHARARSKADRAPRGGSLIQAEEQPEQPEEPQPERPKRAPRSPRPAEATQGDQGGGLPGGWVAVGLGVALAAGIGAAIYHHRNQGDQGNQGGGRQSE